MSVNASPSDGSHIEIDERELRAVKRSVNASHNSLKSCLDDAKNNWPLDDDQFFDLRVALTRADNESQFYITKLQNCIDKTPAETTRHASLIEEINHAYVQKDELNALYSQCIHDLQRQGSQVHVSPPPSVIGNDSEGYDSVYSSHRSSVHPSQASHSSRSSKRLRDAQYQLKKLELEKEFERREFERKLQALHLQNEIDMELDGSFADDESLINYEDPQLPPPVPKRRTRLTPIQSTKKPPDPSSTQHVAQAAAHTTTSPVPFKRSTRPSVSHGPANQHQVSSNSIMYVSSVSEKRSNSEDKSAKPPSELYHHDFVMKCNGSIQPQQSSSVNYGTNVTAPAPSSDTFSQYLQMKMMNKRENKFDGDPLGYPSFRNEFVQFMNRCPDDLFRFNHLISSVTGDALDSIQHCRELLDNPAHALNTALEALTLNFGAPHKVRQAHLTTLTDSTKPVLWEEASLRSLLNDLVKTRTLLRDSSHKVYLDLPDNIFSIVSRLPSKSKSNFVNKCNQLPDPDNPGFDFLVEFVKEEMKFVGRTFTSLLQEKKFNNKDRKYHVNKDHFTKPPNPPSRFHRSSSASKEKHLEVKNKKQPDGASGTGKENRSAPDPPKPPTKKICCICKKPEPHKIKDCEQFKKMTTAARWNIVKKQPNLCPACFGTHQKSNCRSTGSCFHCGSKEHHSLLCEDCPVSNISTVQSGEPQVSITNPQQVSSFSAASKCHPGYVRVVPLKAFSSSGESTNLYALLDSGSDITLITREATNKLKLKGSRFLLRLQGVTSLKNIEAEEVSLSVQGFSPQCSKLQLNKVTCIPDLPGHAQSIPSSSITNRHPHLQGIEFPSVSKEKIDLIIGSDFESLHHVFESRTSPSSSLCAHRTPLGWVLAGPDDKALISSCQVASTFDVCSYHSIASDHPSDINDSTLQKVQEIMHSCVERPDDEETTRSIEDERVLELFRLEKSRTEEGNIILPIPYYDKQAKIPNNKSMAISRLMSLRKSLLKDPDKADLYCKKMRSTINKHYLNLVSSSSPLPPECKDRIVYIPHFCTGQVKNRIVFDAATTHLGKSFNSFVMQGPDLMQPLVDVIVRFRQDNIAFACDIQEMFYQVKVAPGDRTVRILWFKNDDLNGEIEEYEFSVHAFGWKSSPAAANYAVRQTAIDNLSEASPETVQTMMTQLYVDDCLDSESTVQEAIYRAKDLNELGKTSGFHFTKYTSNSREFLQALDPDLLAPEIQEIDLDQEEVPTHKALGVYWCPSTDQFVVRVNLPSRPATRRGLLSLLHITFDPLGIVLPYIVKGRRIMQDAFTGTGNIDWDAPLPNDVKKKWNKFLAQLKSLDGISIPRCYHTSGPRPATYELHTFSDASNVGLAAVSFLRFYKDGAWHCAFIRGKGRLLKKDVKWSVARYELDAAVMASELHKSVSTALELPVSKNVLWSDSGTVLSWIKNTERRPKIFVYNRRKEILRHSAATDWKYVNTLCNPADLATRGLSSKKLSQQSLWLKGPDFLYTSEEMWPVWDVPQANIHELEWVPDSIACILHDVTNEECDDHNKSLSFNASTTQQKLFHLLWKYSKLGKLTHVIAWLMRLSKKESSPHLSAEEVELALTQAIRLSQIEYFSASALQTIKDKGLNSAINSCINKDLKSILKNLVSLSPYVDDKGLLRVGGRLQNSTLPHCQKHPIILPKRHNVTKLLVEDCHLQNRHFGGFNYVLHQLRSNYWITASTVKFYLNQCLGCIRIRAKTGKQIMAPLPPERTSIGGHPFQACGIDYMGPVLVKVKRSNVKRWVAVFTCLATRAVHIEKIETLHTSSFLNGFIRFKCARGNVVKIMYSDNASTFQGADTELKQALLRLENEGFSQQMLSHGVDWKFNSPLASHQGGVWERLIRSIRKVLLGIPALQNTVPTDDTLLTYLKEAENIINNRPLTVTTSDPEGMASLTPGMLLVGSLAPSSPIDVFHSSDQLNRDWRHAQVATEQFWSRFVREYLSNLQPRSKWYDTCKNVKIDDIVLLKEARLNYRPNYPMARIIAVHPGIDGLVRNVDLKLADGRTFTRDIRKIVPLECTYNNH